MCGDHGAGRVLRYLTGPASDEWCTNTAFVEISLMPSEWTIAIEKYRVVSSFAMRAIVAANHYQRFFIQIKILFNTTTLILSFLIKPHEPKQGANWLMFGGNH